MARAAQSSRRPNQLLLTCEHAGNRIPREYAELFRGASDVLASHRGWDPGAMDVAKFLGRRFQLKVPAVFWSRLLVESNRSPTNPRIWSKYTSGLSVDERQRILARYWQPHRDQVETCVRDVLRKGGRVVHIAVHSFTDQLDDEIRNADVGLLYDPARRGEREICRRWELLLRESAPWLRVRRNYPYRGSADGLSTWLRRKFPDSQYVGIELELRQGLLASQECSKTKAALAESLGRLFS
ncbi:MAG: N-formylglutamate amidohydrolase [Pirellulales bacterium]